MFHKCYKNVAKLILKDFGQSFYAGFDFGKYMINFTPC